MKESGIRCRMSDVGIQKLAFCLLFPAFCFLFISGCAHLKEYSKARRRLSAISTGNLEGLSKSDIIKKFGEPLATSKSETSECWYYAHPREIWIWFAQNKVERWEVKTNSIIHRR